MASFLVWGGRVLFFALIVTQSFLFAAYPAEYKDDSRWYAMAASQALSVIFWLRLVLTSEAKLHRLCYVWGFYIFGLVISILTVFAHVGNILDKERFFGPNVLKTTLCITPSFVAVKHRQRCQGIQRGGFQAVFLHGGRSVR